MSDLEERRGEWTTPEQHGPVIVPLDGSEAALTALPVARVMAQLSDTVVHVVHAGEQPLEASELPTRLGLKPDQVRGLVVEDLVGTPAAAILALARRRRASFIVMSTRSDARRRALGPVAAAVLGGARRPVLLVRPERGLTPWLLTNVLVPHDGTPATAAAIAPAVRIAHRAGAQLSVLHVTTRGEPRTPEPGTMTTPRYVDQPQHEWPAWAQEFLERMRGLGHLPPDVRLRVHLAKGQPAREAVRFARQKGVDLIVLVWQGDLSPKHAITVKTAIRLAPCPILLIPQLG